MDLKGCLFGLKMKEPPFMGGFCLARMEFYEYRKIFDDLRKNG
jgi:hypothetical protein